MNIQVQGPSPNDHYIFRSLVTRVVLVRADAVCIDAIDQGTGWVDREFFDKNFAPIIIGEPSDGIQTEAL